MGKFILDYYNWHGIFYVQVIISMLVSFWFGDGNQRHYPLKTKKFFTRKVYKEFKELIKFKRTIGFTIISGFITGSLWFT
jgi:DHA1 family bicyclomycin/chloramphenicol resistance-like MFS transporter